VRNFPRDFRALHSPRTGCPIAIGLSKGSAIIEGTVAWYVDAQTGAVGRARLIASEPRDPGATTRAGEVRSRPNQPPGKRDLSAAPAVIVAGRPVPHFALFKATLPAGTGARQSTSRSVAFCMARQASTWKTSGNSPVTLAPETFTVATVSARQPHSIGCDNAVFR